MHTWTPPSLPPLLHHPPPALVHSPPSPVVEMFLSDICSPPTYHKSTPAVMWWTSLPWRPCGQWPDTELFGHL